MTTLLLINGHGGSDPGAVRGHLIERDLNIDAVLALNDFISKTYETTARTIVKTLIYSATAPFEADSGLLDKIAKANAEGPTAVTIELHHNIADAGSGAQVWCSQFAARTPEDRSAVIAPLIAAQLGAVVGDVVPIVTSDHSRFGRLGICDDVVGTAILVECRRVELATDPVQRYATGAAIAKALGAFFMWPLKSAPIVVAPPPAIDPRLARAKELAAQIVAL